MEVGSSRKGVRRKKSHLYLTFLFFFLFRCCCCWFFSCYIIIPFSLLLLFSLPLSDALQRSKENKQKEKINACTLCRLVTRCCMRFFLRLTRTHTHTQKKNNSPAHSRDVKPRTNNLGWRLPSLLYAHD